jgi:molecular chaperone GrpE (heat shock protein)
MKVEDFPRVEWRDDLWEPTRDHCLSLTRLPESGSEERVWLDAKPTREMLLEMVSILDGLERLVSLAERDVLDVNPVLDNWLTSIRGLRKRMARSLERVGVVSVPSIGRPFDPKIHEILEIREDRTLPPGTVVEVKEKPYRWGDRVLRVGKVVTTPKNLKNSTSRRR